MRRRLVQEEKERKKQEVGTDKIWSILLLYSDIDSTTSPAPALRWSGGPWIILAEDPSLIFIGTYLWVPFVCFIEQEEIETERKDIL